MFQLLDFQELKLEQIEIFLNVQVSSIDGLITETQTMYVRDANPKVRFHFPHKIIGITYMAGCYGMHILGISGNTVYGGYGGNDRDISITCIGY